MRRHFPLCAFGQGLTHHAWSSSLSACFWAVDPAHFCCVRRQLRLGATPSVGPPPGIAACVRPASRIYDSMRCTPKMFLVCCSSSRCSLLVLSHARACGRLCSLACRPVAQQQPQQPQQAQQAQPQGLQSLQQQLAMQPHMLSAALAGLVGAGDAVGSQAAAGSPGGGLTGLGAGAGAGSALLDMQLLHRLQQQQQQQQQQVIVVA